MHHKIWKQTVECVTNLDRDQAWRVQDRLASVFLSQAFPVLERHLDVLAPEKEHIIINRVECDLGTIDINHLESGLVAALDQFLPGSLKSALDREGNHARARSPAPEDPAGLGRLPQKPSPGIRLSESSQVLKEIMAYLNTGTLSWSFGDLSWDRFCQEAAGSLSRVQHEDIEALKLVLKSEHARQRLTRQFPPHFAETCILALWPEAGGLMEFSRRLVIKNRVFETLPDRPEPLSAVILRAVLELVLQGNFADMDEFVRLVEKSLATSWALFPEKIDKRLERISGRKKEKLFSRTDKKQARPPQQADQPMETKQTEKGVATPKSDRHTPLQADPVQEALLTDFSISNAGVVMVSSFLPRYFQALSLTNEKNGFLGETQRQKAVLALQILSGGPEFPPEYTCVLSKVLCGMPVHQPFIIDPEIDLNLIEKEALALLCALIRHWAVLKNATPSGVRQTFLKREGILRQTDRHWMLHVSRKGVDILVDALPWSFSLVKTAWMDKPLEVQW